MKDRSNNPLHHERKCSYQRATSHSRRKKNRKKKEKKNQLLKDAGTLQLKSLKMPSDWQILPMAPISLLPLTSPDILCAIQLGWWTDHSMKPGRDAEYSPKITGIQHPLRRCGNRDEIVESFLHVVDQVFTISIKPSHSPKTNGFSQHGHRW